MAYTVDQRNDLDYRRNGFAMLCDELLKGIVDEHDPIVVMDLAAIRVRMSGRGIDSAETDRLIAHYTRLDTLIGS